MKSCEKCGRPIADTAAACPYCGYSQAAELPNALQPGWEIAGRYRIESVIGLGGFGIGRAYERVDLRLGFLDKIHAFSSPSDP